MVASPFGDIFCFAAALRSLFRKTKNVIYGQPLSEIAAAKEEKN
jgi:hypothetical protein